MTDIAHLGYAVDSSDLDTATKKLSAMDKAASSADKSAEKITKSTGSLGVAARKAAGVVGALAGAMAAAFSSRAILGAADDYAKLTNGLKAMGASSESAAAQLQQIADIAIATRSPLEATAQLYTRISIASKELGASQQDVAEFTTNVGLALGAAGIGANEASGALTQLSQAMAGGVVRSEEFNSILENAFPLAQAAANGIDEAGGSVGRLRALVVDGKISSKEFFDAILSQSEELATTFGNTSITMGQAMTNIQTSMTSLVGKFDQATGSTGAIATALNSAAEVIAYFGNNIEMVIGFVISASTALTVYLAPAIYSAVMATGAFIASLITLKGALIATGIGAAVIAAGWLIGKLIELTTYTGRWGSTLKLLGEVADGVWEGIKTSASSIGPALNSVWETVKASFYSMLEGLATAWTGFLSSIGATYSSMPAWVPGAQALGEGLSAQAGDAMATVSKLNAYATSATSNATKLKEEAAAIATDGYDKATEAAGRLAAAVAEVPAVGALADGVLPSAGVDDGAGGKGGKSKTDTYASDLEKLTEALATERETLDAWYNEGQALLADRRATEILGVEGHKAALLALEEDYQTKLKAIQTAEQTQRLNDTASFFGSLQSIAASSGDNMAKAAATFGAIQATINSYVAATAALATPGITLFGRIAAYASVLSTGLAGVAAIKSAGGSSSSSTASTSVASTSVSGTTVSAAESATKTVKFNVTGTMSGLVEEIIEQIYTATKDGTKVIFTS